MNLNVYSIIENNFFNFFDLQSLFLGLGLSFIFSLCFSALILTGNMIDSLLLLILIFMLGSMLLFKFNISLIAIIFLMIYLGAILVLFLFVVMLLDLKISNIINQTRNISILQKIIGLTIFLSSFIIVLGEYFTLTLFFNNLPFYWSNFFFDLNFYNIINLQTNSQVIGSYIFDYNPFLFILAGIILYIAMIGAIVISVDKSLNFDQKIQDPIVQGMRQSNIVFYINKKVNQKNIKMVKKLHWSHKLIWWYKKPIKNLWSWMPKTSI